MGFQHGISGIAAATKQLDTIGNNVANAGTIGFKGSRAEFSDMFASNFYGVAATQVGLGAKTDVVAQQFAQGNTLPTGNQLDMAISGNGFFVLKDTNGTAFTRNGQFKIDREGYIVSNGNANLQGWAIDEHSTILKGTQTDLRVDNSLLAPRPTDFPDGKGKIDWNVNVNSSAPIVNVAANAFDPMNRNTFTHMTSTKIYDSLGNDYKMNLYFVHKGKGQWDVHARVIDHLNDPDKLVNLNDGAGGPVALEFDEAGKLKTPADGKLNFADFVPKAKLLTGNGEVHANPVKIVVDFTGSSQVNMEFSNNQIAQPGYGPSIVTGLEIDKSGVVSARYSNGQYKVIGQVILANFPNQQGLQPIGGNQWVQTYRSGAASYNDPGSTNVGLILSQTLEEANIDLTQELVSMITAQRYYQANAQTIKVQDAVLQTVMNLR